jgi:hypothetical protein
MLQLDRRHPVEIDRHPRGRRAQLLSRPAHGELGANALAAGSGEADARGLRRRGRRRVGPHFLRLVGDPDVQRGCQQQDDHGGQGGA